MVSSAFQDMRKNYLSKAKDEIKQEIVTVAGEMAGRFIKDKMDEQKQAALVDDVIREMGDATWRQD